MTDDEVDGPAEAAALPSGEDEWDPGSDGETWCNDELALDQPGETEAEDETLILEEGYEIVPPADPDLWLYRDRTCAILRRYLRLAVEVGRLPALLGREFFRTRVSSYHTQTFEDTVIFVHDVERCLGPGLLAELRQPKHRVEGAASGHHDLYCRTVLCADDHAAWHADGTGRARSGISRGHF